MLSSRLFANWKLTASANKFLLTANLLLALTVLVMSALATGNRERVVVMPPTIDKPLSVGWDSATVEYYKSMALYFSGVIGMVGPNNLSYVYSVIEKFAARPIAEAIKTKLRMQAASYEFRNSTATAWFEGGDLVWEAQRRKVFVIGKLKTITAAKQEASKSVVYEYVIDIVEGRPVISDFDSYEGNEAHTLTFLANKKRAELDQKRKEETVREMTEAIRTQPPQEGAQ